MGGTSADIWGKQKKKKRKRRESLGKKAVQVKVRRTESKVKTFKEHR